MWFQIHFPKRAAHAEVLKQQSRDRLNRRPTVP
jgi:hypothetical protein